MCRDKLFCKYCTCIQHKGKNRNLFCPKNICLWTVLSGCPIFVLSLIIYVSHYLLMTFSGCFMVYLLLSGRLCDLVLYRGHTPGVDLQGGHPTPLHHTHTHTFTLRKAMPPSCPVHVLKKLYWNKSPLCPKASQRIKIKYKFIKYNRKYNLGPLKNLAMPLH